MIDYIEKHFSRLLLFVFSIDFLILLIVSAIFSTIANKLILGGAKTSYISFNFLYFIVFVLISLVMLFINELYTVEKKYQKNLLVFKCVLSFTVVSISCYLLFIRVFSYYYCFILSMVACISILSWRLVFYWVIPKINLQHKILFLGTDDLSRKVVREILDEDHPKFKVVGFIGNDSKLVGKSIVNPRVLGLAEDIDAIIKKEKIEKLIASYSQARGEFPANDLVKCKFKGIEVLDLHTFYEHLKGKILLDSLRPSWIIFSQGFKKRRFIRFQKRIFDILLSCSGLLISLPISIIAILFIKFETKGPVIYKQARVGENGDVFNLYKFRSMRIDAEGDTGPIWAEEDDCRVTRAGKFLRKFHIDEIPQMINVLKGDMSFVGPRPERPYFVNQLIEQITYYDYRHSIKPGITGWAAVNYSYGASVGDAMEKLQYDLYYIKNISLFLDLIIILKTITIVLGRKGSR